MTPVALPRIPRPFTETNGSQKEYNEKAGRGGEEERRRGSQGARPRRREVRRQARRSRPQRGAG